MSGLQADIAGGFADPTFASQAAFRKLLHALSRPGEVVELVGLASPPPGLCRAAAVALLTLADYETPVWLPPDGAFAWSQWLTFHTGAPIVDDVAAARFVLIDGAKAQPRLGDLDAGEDRYPDRSATAIVLCAALEDGTPVDLSGPGIETSARIAPAGLRAGFWQECADNHRRYPLGVDLFLVAENGLLGLPRSTRVRAANEAR